MSLHTKQRHFKNNESRTKSISIRHITTHNARCSDIVLWEFQFEANCITCSAHVFIDVIPNR